LLFSLHLCSAQIAYTDLCIPVARISQSEITKMSECCQTFVLRQITKVDLKSCIDRPLPLPLATSAECAVLAASLSGAVRYSGHVSVLLCNIRVKSFTSTEPSDRIPRMPVVIEGLLILEWACPVCRSSYENYYGRPPVILFYSCSLDLLLFCCLISEVAWPIVTKLRHMFDGDPDL